jgi:hypothetical protein
MTVVAESVALRTVVLEWARVGGVRLVDPQHVSLAPVSIELRDLPEGEALKVLLRTLPGYLLQKRSVGSEGSSLFEKLAVMAPAAASMEKSVISTGSLTLRTGVIEQPSAEAPDDPSSPPAGMAPSADGAVLQRSESSGEGVRTAPSGSMAMPGQARPGLLAPGLMPPAKDAKPVRQ